MRAEFLVSLSEDAADAGETHTLIADALAMIGAPQLAMVFDPAALTEVHLTADLPGLGRLHGAIDRLLIRPGRITAIDFKTNRIVPAAPEAAPEGILRQMGAYRAMLAQIYANHAIDMVVLWTASGQLMPIPPALCMAALHRAATA
jgi:ATP-dependent helicase/nuclease subunit A